VGAPAYSSNQGRVYAFNNPFTDLVPDATFTGASADEQLGTSLAGGKGAADSYYVLAMGGPFWDDTGETDAGRNVVASIPELSDVPFVAVLVMLILVVLRRRRNASVDEPDFSLRRAKFGPTRRIGCGRQR